MYVGQGGRPAHVCVAWECGNEHLPVAFLYNPVVAQGYRYVFEWGIGRRTQFSDVGAQDGHEVER
jgi:hypothetical protein